MLIIAIGHGGWGDPFTCSCDSNDTDINNPEAVLIHISAVQDIDQSDVDEILIVQNDKVLHSFIYDGTNI